MRIKNAYHSKKTSKESMFYDFISKKTYIIPKDKEKLYNAYKNRYFITAIGVILSANFLFSPATCIAIGLTVLGFSEYKYRKSFLPSLPEVKEHNITEKLSLFEINQGHDKNKLFTKGILYLLLSILLVLNALVERLSIALFLISCLIALYSLFSGVNCFVAYKKRRLSP